MNELTRIQKTSRVLRIVLIVVLMSLPVLSFLYWMNFNNLPSYFVMRNLPDLAFEVNQDLSFHARLLCFCAGLIPLGVQIAGIWVLIRLFGLYERLSFFSEENVVCFRKLGKILLAWVASGLAHKPLLALALTMDAPPGGHMISIGIGSPDITALIAGVMILVISWVMEQGRKLEDELLHTV